MTVPYSGVNAGADLVQASASLNGLGLWSNQLPVTWVSAVAPQIEANCDQTLQMPNAGLCTATVTDPAAPAGGKITVQWSQVSGPAAVLLDTPTQTSTHVLYPAPGTYMLQIVATDSLGSNTLLIGPITVQPPVTTTQGWIASPKDHTQVSGQVPITVASGITLTGGTLTYYSLSNPST